MSNSTTTLIVDSDTFVYAAAVQSETAVEWDEDGILHTQADLNYAKAHFQDAVDALANEIPHSTLILALSDSAPCFRKDVYPPYKGGRKQRPLAYKALREWVVNPERPWRTYLRPRLEADDILGILGTHPSIIEGRALLWSLDKDLLTVPGFHWDHDLKRVVRVSEEEAERAFLTQVLTGDVVDNYPGCPGIGAKRAPAIVDEGWPGIVKAYQKAGLTEQDALIQARCARILRASDYDFKRKEPILWTPPAASAGPTA